MAFRTPVLCLVLALVPAVVVNATLPMPTSADTLPAQVTPQHTPVVTITAVAIGGFSFWFFFRRRRQQGQPAHT